MPYRAVMILSGGRPALCSARDDARQGLRGAASVRRAGRPVHDRPRTERAGQGVSLRGDRPAGHNRHDPSAELRQRRGSIRRAGRRSARPRPTPQPAARPLPRRLAIGRSGPGRPATTRHARPRRSAPPRPPRRAGRPAWTIRARAAAERGARSTPVPDGPNEARAPRRPECRRGRSASPASSRLCRAPRSGPGAAPRCAPPRKGHPQRTPLAPLPPSPFPAREGGRGRGGLGVLRPGARFAALGG